MYCTLLLTHGFDDVHAVKKSTFALDHWKESLPRKVESCVNEVTPGGTGVVVILHHYEAPP